MFSVDISREENESIPREVNVFAQLFADAFCPSPPLFYAHFGQRQFIWVEFIIQTHQSVLG